MFRKRRRRRDEDNLCGGSRSWCQYVDQGYGSVRSFLVAIDVPFCKAPDYDQPDRMDSSLRLRESFGTSQLRIATAVFPDAIDNAHSKLTYHESIDDMYSNSSELPQTDGPAHAVDTEVYVGIPGTLRN